VLPRKGIRASNLSSELGRKSAASLCQEGVLNEESVCNGRRGEKTASLKAGDARDGESDGSIGHGDGVLICDNGVERADVLLKVGDAGKAFRKCCRASCKGSMPWTEELLKDGVSAGLALANSSVCIACGVVARQDDRLPSGGCRCDARRWACSACNTCNGLTPSRPPLPDTATDRGRPGKATDAGRRCRETDNGLPTSKSPRKKTIRHS